VVQRREQCHGDELGIVRMPPANKNATNTRTEQVHMETQISMQNINILCSDASHLPLPPSSTSLQATMERSITKKSRLRIYEDSGFSCNYDSPLLFLFSLFFLHSCFLHFFGGGHGKELALPNCIHVAS
jgi:hypothetical protein